MAVAFDATFTAPAGANSGSVFNTTAMTVGSGATALLITLVFSGNVLQSGTTVTWDQGGTNQAMTLIGTLSDDGIHFARHDSIQFWGLVAPTVGNKTLRVSSSSSQPTSIEGFSVTGSKQTSVAAAFTNFVQSSDFTSASSTSSATVTSATGDMVAVLHFTPNGFASVDNTAVFVGGVAGSAQGCAMNRAAGAASATLTAAESAPPDNWLAIGINIVQESTATAGKPSEWPNPQQRRPQLLGHTASFQLPLQQVLPPRQTDWPVPTGRTLFCDWIYSNVAARPPLIFPDTRQTDWPNPVLASPPLNVGSTDSFKLVNTQNLPTQQTDWPNPVLPRPPLNVGSTNSFELSYQQVMPPRQLDWPNPRGPLPIFRDWTVSFNLSSQQALPPGQFGWTNLVRRRLPVVSDWIYPASHTLILPPPIISRARMYDWPVPRGPRRSIDLLTITNPLMRAPPGPPIAGGPREILKNETGRVRALKNERLRVRWLTKLP